MIFAFTAAALGGLFGTMSTLGWIAAGVADIAIVAGLAGIGTSIYSGYQAKAAAMESAKMQNEAAQAAANAQQMAANAQAQQLKDQAELARLQANVEDKKAGVVQQQGEIEARRRMVQLSYDIGNAYSQWAGNNLLVDGGGDSLGQILTANVREGAQDVGIIKSNAENAVWEHSMNKTMALLSASSYDSQAENAVLAGKASALSTLMSGEANAYATRQAGITALYQGWGSGLSTLASLGLSGVGTGMALGGGIGTGTRVQTNNVYAWNTTGGFGAGSIA